MAKLKAPTSPQTRRLLNDTHHAWSTGIRSHCPFCLALSQQRWPDEPELVFLSGIDVGQRGRIVDEPWTDSRGSFLVVFDHTPPGQRRVVTPGLDNYVPPGAVGPPAWMPPLSIEDNQALHETLFDAAQTLRSGRAPHRQGLFGLIANVWWRRFPLQAEELWPALSAHGAHESRRARFLDDFKFGRDLLVASNGRRPNSRRRMQPFEYGRYLTPRQRELRLRLFGHD